MIGDAGTSYMYTSSHKPKYTCILRPPSLGQDVYFLTAESKVEVIFSDACYELIGILIRSIHMECSYICGPWALLGCMVK